MESLQTSIPYLVQYSYLGVYVLIIFFSIVPLSKTLVIVAAGMLAAEGAGNLFLYLLVSILALSTADGLYYLLGRVSGQRVLAWKFFSGPKKAERLDKARHYFRENEWLAVFTARFLPFIRSFIFLVSGINRMSVARFFAADLLSGLLFAPVFIGLGYFLGENRERLVSMVHEGERWIAVVVVLMLALWFWRRRR